MRRHRHVHAPGDVDFNRLSWRIWDLRRRLCRLMDIHILEGSGDQGHAVGGHHGVLCRRSETGGGEERVDDQKEPDQSAAAQAVLCSVALHFVSYKCFKHHCCDMRV